MVLIKKIVKYMFVYSSRLASFWGFLLVSCFFIFERSIFFSLLISLFLSTVLLFFAVKKGGKRKKEIDGFFDPAIIRLFSMAWIFFALKSFLVPVVIFIIALYVVSKSFFKKLGFVHVLINSIIGVLIGFLSFYLVSLVS
jgi:hypothetical protein